jgi:hypothetical protein
MKKLFFKLLLFLIPALILISATVYLPPSKSFQKSMFYSLIDKNKLLENTPSPRIIFIGGSNLSFGLNSQMIKDSLQLNPINTGIHAGIGLKYMLSNTENYIIKNDIIVVSPEYQQFYSDVANGEVELLSTIVDVSPNSFKLLDYKQYYTLIQKIPAYLKTKWSGLINKSGKDTIIGIYDRKAINSFGDIYVHWKFAKEKVTPFGKIEGKLNDDAFKSLNKFRDCVNSRKARLFITFPCYQDLSFKNQEIQIKEVERNLNKYRFILLSNPERYIIPDSLIYNTPYHLTKKGVDLRTSLLIEDLKRVL